MLTQSQIEYSIKSLKSSLDYGVSDYIDTMALENALEALEKQIPKKVELYTNGGNFKWKNYPCPCCKEMLGLNVNKRYVKFCPKCGHALD